MSLIKKILTDGPVSTIKMIVTNVFKNGSVASVYDKLGVVVSLGLQITAAIVAAPLSLPASIVSAISAVHTFLYNVEDLIDDGLLNKSSKE